MKKIAIVLTVLSLSLTTVFALEEGLSINTLPSGQKVIIKEVKDKWHFQFLLSMDFLTQGKQHSLLIH
jgi:hypothetical protein